MKLVRKECSKIIKFSAGIKEIANDENVDPYIVACWDDKSEALDSPYGKVISKLDNML